MIGIIAAVSVNGVIGQDNKIPFDYPADLKHFRETTLNSVIVMGRKTFEGIGKPLPKRENVVITSSELDISGVRCMKSIHDALLHYKVFDEFYGSPNIWLIGGAGIYQEGMKCADIIVLTLTPDTIEGEGLVRFPWVNPDKFRLETIEPMETDIRLKIATYHRKR